MGFVSIQIPLCPHWNKLGKRGNTEFELEVASEPSTGFERRSVTATATALGIRPNSWGRLEKEETEISCAVAAAAVGAYIFKRQRSHHRRRQKNCLPMALTVCFFSPATQQSLTYGQQSGAGPEG